jgi:hypothetical protein
MALFFERLQRAEQAGVPSQSLGFHLDTLEEDFQILRCLGVRKAQLPRVTAKILQFE